MTPVLAIFIDALKPESVEHMEFLRTLYKARIRTELVNYSNTCHASIYTGVYPNKHNIQFIWKYSPETSPFKWLRALRVHKLLPVTSLRFVNLIYRIITFLKSGSSIYGTPFLLYLPLDQWALFDFDVVKHWGKPDLSLGGYPTIFKILEDCGIKYKVVWAVKNPIKSVKSLVQPKTFNYIFIGKLDPLSHIHGQNSPEVRSFLKSLDKALECKYREFEKKFGDFTFMVFSDHGHIEIENAAKNRINLHKVFKLHGENLSNYIFFIDAVHARFWFRNDKEREKVEKIVSRLDNIIIFAKEILKKYNANMPDNRYGDLIIHSDWPFVFDTVDEKTKSMHGYFPDYPDSDGVFIANRKIKESYVKLQDIAPSILQALGLEIPDYIDGEPIWR